jgi:hypothetical protein
VGFTVTDPEVGKVPAPGSGLMLTELAFVVVHFNVVLLPAVMVAGSAEKDAVGAGAGGGGGVESELPPHPANASARRLKTRRRAQRMRVRDESSMRKSPVCFE